MTTIRPAEGSDVLLELPTVVVAPDVAPAMVPDPAAEVEVEPEVTHQVAVADEGSFTVARCACGWRSPARRSRPRARAEGQDHEVLHGPPTGI